MIARNKGKLMIFIITLVVISCFLVIRNLLIENSILTNEEIQKCKQEIGVILSGKGYDKEAYNICYTLEDDAVITYVHDKIQSVKFFVEDNKIVDYKVMIDELSLSLNCIFALLCVIYIWIFIVLLAICIFTTKFDKTQIYHNEFNY